MFDMSAPSFRGRHYTLSAPLPRGVSRDVPGDDQEAVLCLLPPILAASGTRAVSGCSMSAVAERLGEDAREMQPGLRQPGAVGGVAIPRSPHVREIEVQLSARGLP